MTFTAVLIALFGWATWLLQFFFLAGWAVVKAVLWAASPVWLGAAIIGVVSAFFTAPAQAGWFWGPDPKIEAANRALEQAAQIATEAARTQSSQQSQLLAAIQALSSERSQIAGQLGRLGEMAARDSSWAAAVQAAGPVLVAVVVLVLGCAAIWLVTRASDHDSQLATVLVAELCDQRPDALGSSQGDSEADDPASHQRIDIYSPLRPDTVTGLPPTASQTTSQDEEGGLPF